VRRDQAVEVVVGQAPVDAVIERRGRSIKISPDQGAPYAARADGRSIRGWRPSMRTPAMLGRRPS